MKLITLAILVLFAGCIMTGMAQIRVGYEYETSIGSYWELSEKASTLQQKSAYLDKYVAAVSAPKAFAKYDATLFPTPNSSFEQNMVALKSLQGRMHQIQGMDEQSFAYQTAIQQITAQEQGEAHGLTSTFEGCWLLRNHPLFWGWHMVLLWLALVLPTMFLVAVALTTL